MEMQLMARRAGWNYSGFQRCDLDKGNNKQINI